MCLVTERTVNCQTKQVVWQESRPALTMRWLNKDPVSPSLVGGGG